jgi:hypothetical protein
MDELKLEFEENVPGNYPRVFARVVLEGYSLSRQSGMPAVTRDCDRYCELNFELEYLECQIKLVRKAAQKLYRQYDQKRASANEFVKTPRDFNTN